MDGDQVRNSFIRFFEEKGHLHMPSASLIPAGDPTLLFTSAGMVPFKPFFIGEQTPPSRRLTSSQKSFRTTDIDDVGDHKHLTFFEMLGNFSIGDYFKEGAIDFAWELVTGLFKLSPDRMFVTIHLDDDEAFRIWRDNVGVPVERIYRYGDSDNWWGPAGTEGPTGPCSELHYDGGDAKGCGPMVTPDELTAQLKSERDGQEPALVPGCHPNCDCERFVELWNLVFMQYYQDPQRNRTPLPAPSVDTGMGLERAAAVLQGKSSVYETDLFWPIIQKVCELTGRSYGMDPETDYALRVVGEHSRAAAFLIGDGVVPGNEGRGYVLRRVIRRAIRYGRRLGLDSSTGPEQGQSFLAEVVETVLPYFRHVYRELLENHDFILRVVRLEEERFGQTYERGSSIFSGMAAYRANVIRDIEVTVDDEGRINYPGTLVSVNDDENTGAELAQVHLVDMITESQEYSAKALEFAKSITGHETFVLYDTYGFPPELTQEIAREQGLEVDMLGFEREMEAQRERARSAQAFTGSMEMGTVYETLGIGQTPFVGYEGLRQETTVAAILVAPSTPLRTGPSTSSGVGEQAGRAVQGQQVEIVLNETPFYAEGGGQVGDSGTISGPNGVVKVSDTQSPIAGLVVHRGVVDQGDITLGDPVTAQVDLSRRLDAARNHSGTHLLHASLRLVLGPHVRQAGSLVAPERLRFDFSHVSPLSPAEIRSVQSLANERIRDNLKVHSRETTYSEAVRGGALAFFGDRYGDVVRVVSMSNGGTFDSAQDRPLDPTDGETFSLEVCGGTHVTATGQVGTLFVLGEASIGGGMRRIEAVTGQGAGALFQDHADQLDRLSRKLQTPIADLEVRLESFMRDNEELRRRLESLERSTLRVEAEQLLGRVVDVDGAKVVAGRTSAASPDAMREMGDFLKSKLSSVAVVLAAVVEGSAVLVAMVTPDLVARGVNAGDLARETAKILGGGGGGRPELAQAGGRQVNKLDEALGGLPELVRRSLS